MEICSFRDQYGAALSGSKSKRFELIHSLLAKYSIAFMAQALCVSYAGYKYWRNSRSRDNLRQKSLLAERVRQVYLENYSSVGARRIQAYLLLQRCYVSLYKIRKLMKLAGIVTHRYRQRAKRKLYMNSLDISDDYFSNDFRASEPNRKWVTDVTEVKAADGSKFYLCIVVDLYERQIVGWSTGISANTTLAIAAMKAALIERGHPAELILRSDNGGEFTSGEFRVFLSKFGIRQSLSRAGRCGDNAVCESMFALIKADCLYAYRFSSLEELNAVLGDYIPRSNLIRAYISRQGSSGRASQALELAR